MRSLHYLYGEWTTPDYQNTPSSINLEEEETVDAPGKDGNASMPEQVKRPNPWRKMMMMMTMIVHLVGFIIRRSNYTSHVTDFPQTGKFCHKDRTAKTCVAKLYVGN